MAIERIANKINTPAELATIVKNFAIQHAGFTDAGVISDANTAFAIRSPQGIYYNFKFANDTIETVMSNSKMPNFTVVGFSQYTGNPTKYPTWNYTYTANFTYPLVGATLITMGKLIAIVIETKVNIFRHHVFGKFDTYNPNQIGGEFASGTTTYIYSGSNNTALPTFDSFTDRLYSNSNNTQHSPFAWGGSSSSIVHKLGASFIRIDNNYSPVNILGMNDVTQYCVQVGSYFTNYSPNNYNGRVMMYPIELYHQPNYNNNSPLIPMFYTQDICRLCVSNLNPYDIVNDSWIVFPVVTKIANPQSDRSSAFDGVAYKFK